MNKKLIIYISIFSIFSMLAFSQEASLKQATRTIDITKQQPYWQAVIGGSAIATPCETSYGFAVSGDGRMISACTISGKVIWQKGVNGKPTAYISSGKSDFLFTVTNDKLLNLINPSGLTLWTKECPFMITESPLTGRDGRVFVRGARNIACYGINGTRKWIVETDEISPLPTCELNDGSILIFLASPENNKTVARRYSPFGAELEKLTFSGIVRTALSCEIGVLVSLDNGSCGLCTVKNGTADSRWVIPSCTVPSSPPPLISASSDGAESAFFSQFGNTIRITIVNTETGKIINNFSVGNGSLSFFCTSCSTENGWFFADTNSAFECKTDGSIIWEAKLPSSSSWNYIFYTQNNYLVLCMKSWVLNAYLMTQNVTVKTKNIAKKKTYNSFYSSSNTSVSSEYVELMQPLFSESECNEIINSFQIGDYGTNETKWISLIQTEISRYNSFRSQKQANIRQEKTYFDTDPAYTSSIISMSNKSETTTFIQNISELLNNESDPTLRTALISSCISSPYDPDGMLLSALQNVLLHKLRASEHTQIILICDAIYEICRFMGRPAFYSKGKEMLTYLFYPQYDKSIRDYARKTLEKLMALEL